MDIPVYFYAYLIWIALLSLITFIVYGVDKSKAKNGKWRIPEATLHWLSVLGGFIGGWFGRSVFRHKTQKKIFTFVLVLSTLIHLALTALILLRITSVIYTIST